MKRIFSITLLLLAIFVSSNLYSQSSDKYGGRSDLKIDNGTGFFRLGKIGDKHFLVTPEGNAFRSIGLNHSHTLTSSNYNKITADMKSMGFNSGDYQGPTWQWNRIPYSKGFSLMPNRTYEAESKFGFRDVFDPVFLTSLENTIKTTVVPHKNNANLICYFLTDTPVWESEKYGKSWLKFFKALDENAPGGKIWKQWKADNSGLDEIEFIRVISRQLYEKATSYIRKYDNNHLIFTERYLEYIFPPKALEEALPFVDGIAIQPKNKLSFAFFDEVYEKYKKPIFVADHVTSFATDEYPNTMGQVAQNEEDYLEYYKWSVQTVMARPYIVGYNKCQYQDDLVGSQLKQGLYKTNGEPYAYLDSLKSIHQKALAEAYKISVTNSAQKLQDWGAFENVKEEAVRRIELHRKGDVHLKVVLPNNDIASNTELKVKLKRHNFLWGAVIRENFLNTPYSEIYKETFLKYFNASGFGLTLKPKWRDTDREANTIDDMNWLLENNIYVRGHALAWEGENFMRPEDKATLNNSSLSDTEKGELLLKSLSEHFTHAIPKWDVKCWDVTNEPIANNAVNDLFPNFDTHAYWFKLADSVRRANSKEDVVLFENDYQIISAIMPWALGRPARYREIIDRHIALGSPVEGIGFQSRLKQGLITPDTIYNRLRDFERYNLPYHATEFEIRDDQSKYVYTDAERSLLTEYMLVMYFSHPKVKGFWHWTFSDINQNQKLDYSLFNYNGSPNVNGQIWMNLMDGFFNTKDTLITSAIGEMNVRGYYGSYQIEAEVNGYPLTGTFEIDSTNNTHVIEVKLVGEFVPTSIKETKNKLKNDVQILFNLNQKFVSVQLKSTAFQSNHLELELYDLYGRKIYSERLNSSNTKIPMRKINTKGFLIAVVKDARTGSKMATKKIIVN